MVKGTYCERAVANCASSQPAECGTVLTSAFCSFSSIAIFCPSMCKSTACTCGIDSCLNGGVFNKASCTCNCPRNFNGNICQNTGAATTATAATTVPRTTVAATTVAATTVAATTVAATTVAATTVTITLTTPTTQTSILTFLTTTPVSNITTVTVTTPTTTAGTTVSTSAVTSCTPLSCANGFTFNAATCSCQCGPGFSGTLCQTFNCNFTPVPDNAAVCPNVPCDGSDFINGNCPFKCLCSGSTGASTVSTATTTTVVTSCTPLTCSNGFNFNAATCACQCGPGFSGNLCQTYNCAFTPVPDNAAVCPNVPCDGSDFINGNCPFKCLCGGSTSG